jgi:prepilin-type N-terminal cleavage/methylation domain-containing protein
MNRRGVTLLELMIVLVLIGAIAGYAFPRIGDAVTNQSVKSARVAMVALFAKARYTAIGRGSTTSFIVNNGQITVQSNNPVTNVTETVGVPEDLVARYGVTVSPSSLTLTFDPRGVGTAAGQTTISITKGSHATSLVISAAGRVIQ